MNLRMARAIAWNILLCTAVLLVSISASAGSLEPSNPLVGRWERKYPSSGACKVFVQIRADGSMTTIDGDRAVDAIVDFAPPNASGFHAASGVITRVGDGHTCDVTNVKPPGNQYGPHDETPQTRATQRSSVLLYAHGDAMALCRIPKLGSCREWFDRVPDGEHRLLTIPHTELSSLFEEELYKVVPEHELGFELVPGPVDQRGTGLENPGGDLDAKLDCNQVVRDSVLDPDAEFGVGLQFWICRDSKTIAAILKKFVARASLDGLLSIEGVDHRRYGLSTMDRALGDGTELLYFPHAVGGGDSGFLINYAAIVDQKRNRALIVATESMEMTERAADVPCSKLCEDPAKVLQEVVVKLARRTADLH